MNAKITEITALIRKLEDDLEAEFARRRLDLAFTVTGGKVRFEEYVLKHHKQIRSNLLGHLLGARPLMVITAPLIYAMIVPFMLLNRGQLAYLNWVEQFNCFYCSYANDVISYVREIAARTEQYWCPIKDARRIVSAHERYSKFAGYGDAAAYQAELAGLRNELNKERGSGA